MLFICLLKQTPSFCHRLPSNVTCARHAHKRIPCLTLIVVSVFLVVVVVILLLSVAVLQKTSDQDGHDVPRRSHSPPPPPPPPPPPRRRRRRHVYDIESKNSEASFFFPTLHLGSTRRQRQQSRQSLW